MPVDVKVRLTGGPSCMRMALLRDASASGGFLETDMRPPVLACVAVEVRLDSGSGIDTWEIQACVVRQDDDGIGVEWQEFAPEVIRLLLPSVGSTVVLARALSPCTSLQM